MGKKEETHERIVENAARMLRKDGYDGVSVATIMKESGLTHGGFYAHFESREALVVEAMERARVDSAALARESTDLATYVQRYLADGHVKKPELGCALAALASETRRQPAEVKAIATKSVESMVGFTKKLGPDLSDDDARVLVCALVGALVLSRAVDSPTLSKQLREAVAKLAEEKE